MSEFIAFPKIGRLSRGIVVSEKIDGSNAQVFIDEETGEMKAGSRTRWITPGKMTDNFGFAGWVADNEEELRKLGPGRHFGEWWGGKIQRGYGITEKRWSLFNTGRWSNPEFRPACCHVVPVLYAGVFQESAIEACIRQLWTDGSVAAPGFNNPEGVVVFHSATNTLFKRTLEGDDQPKSAAA